MGGVPPLGYDVKDRKLVINDDEARTVVNIPDAILRSSQFTHSWTSLQCKDKKIRRRVRPDGTGYGGQKLSPWCTLSDASESNLPRRGHALRASPIRENIRQSSNSRYGTKYGDLPRTGSSGPLVSIQSIRACSQASYLTRRASG